MKEYILSIPKSLGKRLYTASKWKVQSTVKQTRVPAQHWAKQCPHQQDFFLPHRRATGLSLSRRNLSVTSHEAHTPVPHAARKANTPRKNTGREVPSVGGPGRNPRQRHRESQCRSKGILTTAWKEGCCKLLPPQAGKLALILA